MAKRTAAIWIDESEHERLQRLAKVDRRSISQIILMAVEKGLPIIEAELQERLAKSDVMAATVNGALEAAASVRKKGKPAAIPKP